VDRKETFLQNNSMPFSIFDARGDIDTHFLHYHDCLEINFVIEGSGVNYIDDKKYVMQGGDLYLINNFEHHFALFQEKLKMKVILFDPSYIWQNSSENYLYIAPFYSRSSLHRNRIKLSDSENESVVRIISMLDREYVEQENGYGLFLRAGLMELLSIVYRNANSERFEKSGIREYLEYDKIRHSVEYIQSNINKKLRLAELAELSHMSTTYFCSYFKKAMQMNVFEYIELLRINKAKLLISTTEESITEICYRCGYQNISSFNTAFKKLSGVSPATYRKESVYHFQGFSRS